MSEQQQWWYCLRHKSVEQGAGCPNKDRLGPFPTQAAAAAALETVHERNAEWDAQDQA